MDPFDHIKGTHKLVTLQLPGRPPTRILCLLHEEPSGEEAYYVLAECEGRPLKWKSLIKDKAIRRLKDEFLDNIVEEVEVDRLDVETILFCTIEVSNA